MLYCLGAWGVGMSYCPNWLLTCSARSPGTSDMIMITFVNGEGVKINEVVRDCMICYSVVFGHCFNIPCVFCSLCLRVRLSAHCTEVIP